MLVEVKWARLSGCDVDRIIARLERKAEKIPGIESYEKYYAVLAREVEEKQGLVWDLRDFDRVASDYL